MAVLTFEGGLNEQDMTLVLDQECILGYNFELGSPDTHFRPRKPFDKLGTATNALSINGFIQLIKSDDTETTLIQAGDTIYQWDGTTGFTSRGTVNLNSRLRGTTWNLGGYAVITDLAKATVIKKWDGTTFSTLTTGLGSSLYAKYGIVHLGRIWLFNVTAGTNTPHLLVVSAFENPESYDTAKRAQDSSFSTGNEVVYMKKNGSIESIRAVQAYGDIKTDDLSRWIRNTANNITDCITVYDQERQKVYFFIGNNKILVLYKDLLTANFSPWSVYQTGHSSSFAINSAIYMRNPGGTDWYVYFGDSEGNIYQLEGVGDGDAGTTDISVYRKTKFIETIDDFNPQLQRLRGRIYYRRIADIDLLMDFEWGDDYAINRCTVPLEGPPLGDLAMYWGGSWYFGGAYYWNSGFFYSERVSTKGLRPIGRGVGFYLSLSATSSQLFDVMKIEA